MTQKDQLNCRFCDLGIGENFLAVLAQKGFTTPTPIQHQVIPSALQEKDVVGIAQTGTGKTLAFGIPMIQRIARHKGQGLVLVPTRELALQVEEALRGVGNSLGLRSAAVIGGTSQHIQVQTLKRKPHIIIATPGRLADLMEQGLCKLDQVNIVILDEADRMLDIGFLPQIRRILKTVPKERQTMLFSATMPKAISALASEFMKMPLRIEIAPQGTMAENIEHEVFVVAKNSKMRLLDSILQQYKTEKMLIFSRTKYGAKRIARDIRNMGHMATEIHSNRTQAQRKAALAGFTSGKFRVLAATDIAARGIDVKDISIVLNFDLPDNSDDYVHRIGRTGRAGRFGKAISFVTPSEQFEVRKIEKLVRKSLPILALPELPPERKKIPYEGEARNRDGVHYPHFNRGGQAIGGQSRRREGAGRYRRRSPRGRSNNNRYQR